MAPRFGTSGLRGLVAELTEDLVRDYIRAFVAACATGGSVFVGRDLRPSSPQIAGWVLEELTLMGLVAVDCGDLPTPALALAALQGQGGAVMVTGSHIPADRNGLKFYTPAGEISKADEAAILAALGQGRAEAAPGVIRGQAAGASYEARYVGAYGAALSGLRVGVYQHSSVARDLMVRVIEGLGATAIPIARSPSFVPVDTEALDPDTQALFSGWFQTHALDVLISTDGDADRPMLVDEARRVVPGDVLGALTAQALGADVICTPVSSNTQVDGLFGQVIRTRIGSPYVIAAMQEALSDPAARVVGYEANGGFLLGFAAAGPAGPLAPLMTRDCLLPIIAPLAAARAQGHRLADAVEALPPRFTAADRLQGIAPERARAFLEQLTAEASARAAFCEGLGPERGLDLTDGLRMTFEGGEILHLRPSGNAPEFRCYAEAATRPAARSLLDRHLLRLKAYFDTP